MFIYIYIYIYIYADLQFCSVFPAIALHSFSSWRFFQLVQDHMQITNFWLMHH